MSTQQILELQKIEKTLFDLNLDLEELEEFFTKILNKKNNSKIQKITWENCGAPLRKATPEEAKAIAEFEADPQIASKKEVLQIQQELGIKLNF